MDIVVLDNASSDASWVRLANFCREAEIEHRIVRQVGAVDPVLFGSVADVSKYAKVVHLIHSNRNLGFCAGNNLGMAYGESLGCEHLLVLNNDTVCEPGFLEPLVETAETAERAGLVGGLIAYWEDRETAWWAGGSFDGFLETRRVGDRQPVRNYLDGNIRETDWVSGCMMLMPVSIFRRVGGFDERFFVWSEEWDQSLRVRAAGYKLYVDPHSLVYHKVGRSLGVMKPLSYYYGTRNRLLLKKKHLAAWRRLLFMTWFLPSRIPRYLLFLITGRAELADAGSRALIDYFSGCNGVWKRQQAEEKEP
jgi:GT2 family glycosyltransferase